MAKLRMAHASTHGARKPPGPKNLYLFLHIPSIVTKYNYNFFIPSSFQKRSRRVEIKILKSLIPPPPKKIVLKRIVFPK